MERKTFSSGEKFRTNKESSEFLPKVQTKQIDSPYTIQPIKKIRKKYSDYSSKTQESDINIYSKFTKPESPALMPIQKLSEEREDLHLPVLSKKEKKKPLVSSASNYRSPTISPRVPSSDQVNIEKTDELSQVTEQTNIKNPVFKSPKRGSSASRGFRSRKMKNRPSKYASKQRDDNLDTLLMYRNANDFEFLMNEYIRRQSLNEHTKIFVLTGQYEFIRRALKKRGWFENKNSSSCAFHFKWTYTDSDSDYKNLKPGQLFNHFLCNRELTTKSGLSKNLRNITDNKINVDTFFPRCYDLGDNFQVKELIKDYNSTAVLNILKKFTSKIWVDNELLTVAYKFAKSLLNDLQSKGEKCKKQKFEIKLEDVKKCVNFVDKGKMWEENLIGDKIRRVLKGLEKYLPQLDMEGCENVWIIKPGQNARGSGVRCVKDLDEILDSGCKMQSRVVQKYTEKPLLVPMPLGMCKFDLRIWVLVTSCDPLQVYIYNTCYCRLCQEPYTLSNLDAYRHLANFSIQKSIAKSLSATIWPLSQLIDYLSCLKVSWLDILPKIHYIIVQTLFSVNELLEPKPGCFELYGFDILIDSNFTPWLLEVNLSPACAERNEWITQTLDNMAEGLLNIILDNAAQDPLYNSNFEPQKSLVGDSQEWVLLYKGENNMEEVSYTKAQLEIVGEKFNLKREKQWERRFNMNRAAIFIQFHVRAFLRKVRVEKKKINHCVMSIQKIIRRKLAWGKTDFLIRVLKATQIQSFWRMKLAQKVKNYKKFLKYVSHIQAAMKSFKTQHNFKIIKVNRACLAVQCWVRRKLAFDRLAKEKYYYFCVVKIQKFIRKWFLRKINLVKKVQNILRGYLCRKECRKRLAFKRSVFNIQKVVRKMLAVKDVKRRKREKAEKIIAEYEKFRGIVKMLSMFRYGQAAVVIQKYWRRFCSKKIFALKKEQKLIFIDQISFVQKILKGYKERLRFLTILKKRSAQIIQKHFRGYRSRKYYEILQKVHKSALLIQKNFRRYRARKHYLLYRRIYREEQMRRSNFINKKKELGNRGIKATERLFKNKAIPDLPNQVMAKAEKLLYEKEEKIDRIRSIYTQFDESVILNGKYERSSLIKSIIDDMKPQKRDKSKGKKRKKASISITVYGKIK